MKENTICEELEQIHKLSKKLLSECVEGRKKKVTESDMTNLLFRLEDLVEDVGYLTNYYIVFKELINYTDEIDLDGNVIENYNIVYKALKDIEAAMKVEIESLEIMKTLKGLNHTLFKITVEKVKIDKKIEMIVSSLETLTGTYKENVNLYLEELLEDLHPPRAEVLFNISNDQEWFYVEKELKLNIYRKVLISAIKSMSSYFAID